MAGSKAVPYASRITGSRHADFGFLVLFYRDRATLWPPEMFFPTFLGVNTKDPTVFCFDHDKKAFLS